MLQSPSLNINFCGNQDSTIYGWLVQHSVQCKKGETIGRGNFYCRTLPLYHLSPGPHDSSSNLWMLFMTKKIKFCIPFWIILAPLPLVETEQSLSIDSTCNNNLKVTVIIRMLTSSCSMSSSSTFGCNRAINLYQ